MPVTPLDNGSEAHHTAFACASWTGCRRCALTAARPTRARTVKLKTEPQTATALLHEAGQGWWDGEPFSDILGVGGTFASRRRLSAKLHEPAREP
jgi:hypothetical protein